MKHVVTSFSRYTLIAEFRGGKEETERSGREEKEVEQRREFIEKGSQIQYN
jgi:hypothetical protein